MANSKCPLCGSQSFFFKDPVDSFEIYEFDLEEGKIIFSSEVDESELPTVEGETETYCNRCAWHDKLQTLK